MKKILVLLLASFTLSCTSNAIKGRSVNLNGEVKSPVSAEDTSFKSPLGEIPLKVNHKVLNWIDYFQGRGRPHMKRYLSRSSKYLPMMKRILREEGVPEDLVYIALIESGFQSRARSHAGAVGYWQFVRGTARRYGLKVNSYMDERRDFVQSTRAAANYFKALYNLFGNWYLAMASYNAGENKIKRLVMKYYTRDFWELSRRKGLAAETKNYVPKFIAASLIAKNPKQYGFNNIDFEPALNFDSIKINKAISLRKLSKNIGVSYSSLKKLNPSFFLEYIPVYKRGSSYVKVPKEKMALAYTVLTKSRANIPKSISRSTFRYKIRRGDSLYSIAKKFGTSVKRLRQINGLFGRKGRYLKIGKRIQVPEFRGSKSSRKNIKTQRTIYSKATRTKVEQFHRVRSGDHLTSISKKYGVSLRQLRLLNNLSRRSVIKVGQKLKLRGRRSNAIVHIVRRGETLGHIARRYKVSLLDLTKRNDISRKSRVLAGSRLKIPR